MCKLIFLVSKQEQAAKYPSLSVGNNESIHSFMCETIKMVTFPHSRLPFHTDNKSFCSFFGSGEVKLWLIRRKISTLYKPLPEQIIRRAALHAFTSSRALQAVQRSGGDHSCTHTVTWKKGELWCKRGKLLMPLNVLPSIFCLFVISYKKRY